MYGRLTMKETHAMKYEFKMARKIHIIVLEFSALSYNV